MGPISLTAAGQLDVLTAQPCMERCVFAVLEKLERVFL